MNNSSPFRKCFKNGEGSCFLKFIKTFLRSAAVSAVILCICIAAFVGALKIDRAAGYASNSSDVPVPDGVISFSAFGERIDINVENAKKYCRLSAAWIIFWL